VVNSLTKLDCPILVVLIPLRVSLNFRITYSAPLGDIKGLSIMPETLIVMSFLIFRLALSLTLCLTLLFVFCLSSLMDLTIAHMVLVYERPNLSLDTLVTAHVLIVVIISRVGPVFLLEGLTLTLSRYTWTVHIFSIVVHVPIDQVILCKGL
jgi:hypothetical protein